MIRHTCAVLLAVGVALATTEGLAQDSTTEGIAQYRDMLEDDNPAELWQLRGAELWKTKRGPKDA